jgi:hypothetical protein
LVWWLAMGASICVVERFFRSHALDCRRQLGEQFIDLRGIND